MQLLKDQAIDILIAEGHVLMSIVYVMETTLNYTIEHFTFHRSAQSKCNLL